MSWISKALAGAVIIVALGGCDSTEVEPFIESDRYYTVWGVMDMARDTHWVRVIPIGDSIAVSADGFEAPTVTLTDALTGRVSTWQDTLWRFDDGRSGLLYYLEKRVVPGRSYALRIEDSAGRVTTSGTTIPTPPGYDIGPEAITPFGSVVQVGQTFTWIGLPDNPYRMRRVYRFSSSVSDIFRDVSITFEDVPPVNNGISAIPMTFASDRILVREKIADPAKFLFMGLGMEVVLLDSDYAPPGGRFDAEVLSEPGTFTNVDNGFGFFGSIARYSAEWTLSERAAKALGYVSSESLSKREATAE